MLNVTQYHNQIQLSIIDFDFVLYLVGDELHFLYWSRITICGWNESINNK